MSTLGRRIAKARQHKKWTQAELAKAAGVNQGTVSKWETGAETPGDPERLARILGLPVEAFTSGDAVDQPQFIDEIDAQASAGFGAVVTREDVTGSWAMPERWVREQTRGASPTDLKIIQIKGDSGISDPPRLDDLYPGDMVLVDTGDVRPSPPGYFVVFDGVGLLAKRVEVVGKKYRLISNNPRYASQELSEDDARIVGRIRGKWVRL